MQILNNKHDFVLYRQWVIQKYKERG